MFWEMWNHRDQRWNWEACLGSAAGLKSCWMFFQTAWRCSAWKTRCSQGFLGTQDHVCLWNPALLKVRILLIMLVLQEYTAQMMKILKPVKWTDLEHPCERIRVMRNCTLRVRYNGGSQGDSRISWTGKTVAAGIYRLKKPWKVRRSIKGMISFSHPGVWNLFRWSCRCKRQWRKCLLAHCKWRISAMQLEHTSGTA